MLKRIIIILFFFIVVGGCLEETNNLLNAEKIINNSQERYGSIDVFKYTVISTTEFQGEEVTQKIDFLFKKPNKYKCIYQSKNLTTVSNGTVTWIYDLTKGEVTVKHLEGYKGTPDFDYGTLLKGLLKTNNVKLIGEKELFGKSCYIIEAIPKNKTSIISQDMWVDKESLIPVRIDTNYGDYKSRVEYTNIFVSTDVNDNEFEFTLPEGAKIIEPSTTLPNQVSIEEAQKSVNFTILKPSYCAGYQFAGVTVLEYGNSAYLTYSKEGNVLTIFQTPSKSSVSNVGNITIENLKGKTIEIFDNTIIKYNYGNTYIIISGPVSEQELIKIAESLG